MKDYRTLSDWEKSKVDEMIVNEVEPGLHKNENNGFEWTEPDDTLRQVHIGNVCAECLMTWYNCLCSHDS